MQKKVVYAIGGQEQNSEVEFCSEIDRADEIWIYTQDIRDENGNSLLTEDMIEYYQSCGKPVKYRNQTFSPMPRSIKGIQSVIERNSGKSAEKNRGRER